MPCAKLAEAVAEAMEAGVAEALLQTAAEWLAAAQARVATLQVVLAPFTPKLYN